MSFDFLFPPNYKSGSMDFSTDLTDTAFGYGAYIWNNLSHSIPLKKGCDLRSAID